LKPPKHKASASQELLGALKDTPDDSLAEGVIETEGANGSTVEPIYSARKMKCYSVTESELQQLGIANIGVTSFFSLGSACFAFALDIFKDSLLSEDVPQVAARAIEYVQPILIFFGIIFWVIAALALKWRRGMIKLIKDESTN